MKVISPINTCNWRQELLLFFCIQCRFAWHITILIFLLDIPAVTVFLTCVAVEMCKVSKTGACACVQVRRSSKDVSTQVTEEVKLLVMERLLMGLSTAHHWRLVETRDRLEKLQVCVAEHIYVPAWRLKTRGLLKSRLTGNVSGNLCVYNVSLYSTCISIYNRRCNSSLGAYSHNNTPH